MSLIDLFFNSNSPTRERLAASVRTQTKIKSSEKILQKGKKNLKKRKSHEKVEQTVCVPKN